MKIRFKNHQLNKETIESINSLIDMEINAVAAFKLSRIIRELTTIIQDKAAAEKKILDKWMEKDENGEPIIPKDENGNNLEGLVKIKNIDMFTKEMSELMDTEIELPFDKIKFEELGLKTAKIKDILKLDFLFE